MAVTPTANSYERNGQLVAPTADFAYGENPYDPDQQPELYAQWQFQHQGDAQQIGQDYSPGRVGAIIGGTVGAGALGDFLAAGGAAGGAGGGGISTTAPALNATAAPASGSPSFLGSSLWPASSTPTLASSGVPMATGSLPFAAGSSALPAAGGVAGAGAAAPSLITETSGGASGFGPEFAATGQGAAHTTGALNAAGTAATSGTFLQKLQKYLGPALGIGGPIAQAVLSNRANNTAQQQLTQSITQAKADLARLHNQQQSALSPYTSLGAGAAGLLGQGLGVKVQMPDPAVMNNNATIGQPIGGPPVPFGGGNSQPFPGSLQRPVQGPPVGSAVPRVTPSGTSVAPAVQRASSYGGSTVKMLAPDGTTQDVPAEAVSHYKSLGAQVVS